MIDLCGIELNNSYKILEKLGENKIYSIYCAEGVYSPMKFIIKILNYKKSDFRRIEYLQYEKEVLSVYKINNPNLVRIFEIDLYEGYPFISTEYIDGLSLNEYFKNGKEFSYEEILFIMTEIAKGLAVAHHSGAVHRNLNPLNIVLLYENDELLNVKIKNFGFYVLNYLYESTYDEIRDNYKYIACEGFNLLDENIDQRSDLYSLGVLFYRLLTGIVPFDGNDIESLFIGHLNGYEDSLERNYRPEVKPAIRKMIKKLLQTDKYARYQSADGLLADLEKINNGENDFEPGAEEEYDFEAFACRLIGRDEEFALLKKQFNLIKNNSNTLISIFGDTGSGRTALADEFGKYVIKNSAFFIKGESFKLNFPFQPFYEILMRLNAILKLNNADQRKNTFKALNDALKFDKTALLERFEVLKNILNSDKILPPENDIVKAISEFFRSLSLAGKPLVLFFDNADSMDNDSRELIIRIMNSLPGRIMIILSFNFSYQKESRAFLKGIDENLIGKIELLPFNMEQTGDFISELLFEKTKKVSGLISDNIFKQSGGNPFEIIEYLRYYMDKGYIFQYFDEWEIDDNKIRKHTEINFDDMLLHRIQGLRSNEIAVLSYLADTDLKLCIELYFDSDDFSAMDILDIIEHLVNFKLAVKENIGECVVYKIQDKIKNIFKEKISIPKIKNGRYKTSEIMKKNIKNAADAGFIRYYACNLVNLINDS